MIFVVCLLSHGIMNRVLTAENCFPPQIQFLGERCYNSPLF